ncbi:thioesterase family protein [Microdochium nivale]|nr:thioesterase family protein [Microdochium nivale]
MGLLNRGVTWGDMDSFVRPRQQHSLQQVGRVGPRKLAYALCRARPAHGNEWRQLMTMKSVGLILQSITTKYKMPIIYPDTVSVYFRLTRAMPTPTPYLNLQSLILSHKHRRVAATTDEVIVVYDYQAARKTDLPAFAAPLMDQTWRLQQVAARKAAARIAELERGVRELERETWDRADAVEDTGGK